MSYELLWVGVQVYNGTVLESILGVLERIISQKVIRVFLPVSDKDKNTFFTVLYNISHRSITNGKKNMFRSFY